MLFFCAFWRDKLKTWGWRPGPPFCQRPEDGHPSDETEKLYHQHPGQDTNAVDGHIFFGRAPSGHKGLVVFVQGGKAHAEAAGQHRKP